MYETHDACTTILVGKNATIDGSTIVARNEDGDTPIGPKKMVVVMPEQQPKNYQSASKKFQLMLPNDPIRYTATPNANITHGIWGESGINSENVAMSATETITTNARILGIDPYVETGIGEEDLLTIVLPYIKTAEEGVDRLGMLLSEHGTYESNGIAFSDQDEIWWLETIGGHHWVAIRIPDDAYVVATNRFNIDHFDFDAPNVKYSRGLKECIDLNKLNPDFECYNLRHICGSATIKDTHYNNPRAWYIQRYFTPKIEQNPLDQDLPFIVQPNRKITIEDIKWALSSHFQNTRYDPYNQCATSDSLSFRPVAINRNNESHILQIRPHLSKQIRAIHWIAFGPNTFNFSIPFFANVEKIPDFFSKTNDNYDLSNAYWLSLTAGLLGDHDYQAYVSIFERYEEKTMAQFHKLISQAERHVYDPAIIDQLSLINQKNSDIYYENYLKMLGDMVMLGIQQMKLRFSLTDN